MGDSDVNFPIFGLHKPVAYCLAIEENGSDEVHEYVGTSLIILTWIQTLKMER